MGQVLYRQYRPKGLGDIVGQEHITTTLQHALKNGTISHAYLFTGPRGVGKTSVARILAHEINGLPYTDESIHLDIIEIDAASNRRIDEIRDLRSKVNIAPTSAKYKVYIIDEVHMLTREAFNALLKTLEEPPAHVVFILATTEAHKLPETIISRTQRFTFKPVSTEKVVAHLRTIADKEKVKVDDEALKLIAEYGEGSFRDSISLLDQIRNQTSKVTADDVRATLGLAPVEAIEQLIKDLTAHDVLNIVETLNELQQQGFEAAMIATQLGGKLREQLLNNELGVSQAESLLLLKELIEIPLSSNPKIALELALLGTAFAGELQVQPQVSAPIPEAKEIVVERVSKVKAESEVEPKKSTPSVKKEKVAVTDDELWPRLLETIKRQHNTLYSVLRMATPRFENDRLELSLAFAFHQKRLNEPKNKDIIASTIEELSGKRLTIDCVLTDAKPPKGKPVEEKPIHDATLTTISNIFGDAELLES